MVPKLLFSGFSFQKIVKPTHHPRGEINTKWTALVIFCHSQLGSCNLSVTVSNSSLCASLIYGILDHRHKFRASVSKEKTRRLQQKREQAEHFECQESCDTPENVYWLVHLATDQQSLFISDKPISSGQLQGSRQSLSSSDMSSGQPCTFKLSAWTAHSDALHALRDNNEQRSAQTLMASMSPKEKEKENQYPLSSMSTAVFGGESIPDTYSPAGITRAELEKRDIKGQVRCWVCK